MTSRFTGHDPSSGHDTGRLPWAGRQVAASPFAGDDGRADTAVRSALVATADASPARRIEAEERLVAALSDARLLVPIVAEPTEVVHVTRSPEAETDGSPGRGTSTVPADARSDMASVVLTAPDGGRAMPAFTGVDTLSAWNTHARPVPVSATAAARAAIEQSCVAVPLDLGSRSVVALRLSHLWALAQGRPWRPAGRDPHVLDALRDLVVDDERIAGITVDDEPGGRSRVGLTLVDGLSPHAVQERTRRVAAALAEPDVRVRLDEVSLEVRSVG